MAATRTTGTFPIQTTNTDASPHVTITYTPLAVGDLVVLDVATNSPSTVCTGMSGGGCASWTQVGTAQTNNAGGYVMSSTRWMGVISAAVWTSGAVTATATHASTPADSKITGAMFTDAALRPGVTWTVDANHQQVITTATTDGTMVGAALTSTGSNGIAYAQWVPQNSGTGGPGSPWTSAVDTWWTNVVSWRTVTATGTVAAANATASDGQYSRRITIFQAGPSSTPVALAGNASAAAGATGALVAARPLAGIAPAAAGATGVLSAGRPIAGTAAAAGGATGALSRGRPVAGMVPAAAGATGVLSSTRPLAATVAGAGSFTGDLTVLEDGSMSATVAAAASASGALVVARPLAGQVAGAAELTGALIVGRQRALAGTIAGASSADALLTVLGESAWSGNVDAAAELVGALSTARELVGSVDVVAELTGAWHVERPPQPLPTPGDPLPPASSGWRPSPPSTYRPPTVIYA